MKDVHYRFHPRYTAGSPGNWTSATVTAGLFDRLIAEERSAYEHYLEGVYGEPAQKAATAVGLAGIAETRIEAGRGKLRGWQVHDLITDERSHIVSGDPMSKHEERQHAISRYVTGHGECRWCGSEKIELAPDSIGDLVCAGCHDARESVPAAWWSEQVAKTFRDRRESH